MNSTNQSTSKADKRFLLDYNAEFGLFGITPPPLKYMEGWYQSSKHADVYFTRSPYRALSFVGYAGEKAAEVLQPIYEGIQEATSTDTGYVNMDPALADCAPAGKHLYPFQLAGVSAILNREGVFLADEPGLGKTPQTICAINVARPKKVLIVCPALLIYNWYKELQDWLTFEPSVGVFDAARPILQASAINSDICIISYDSLSTREAIFTKIDYDWIVCDEAHYLKNETANRTKVLLSGGNALLKKCKKYILVSGTAAPNRLFEIVTYIKHLRADKFFGLSLTLFNEWFFTKEYDPFKKTATCRELRRGTQAEFRATLYHDWFIRREKKDVLTQLPAKQYRLVTLCGDGQVFQELVARSEALNIEDVSHIPSSSIAAVAEVRHAIGIAKAPLVVEYVKDLLESGLEKVVVFAHHRGVVDVLLTKLNRYNPQCVVGGMSSAGKDKAVAKFQTDPDCRVIVCNLTAGGVGITLTAAHDVVFAEASYVPGENEQAIDRVHRITQTEKVTAHFPSIPNTIDFNVLKTFLAKQEELKMLNNPKEAVNEN